MAGLYGAIRNFPRLALTAWLVACSLLVYRSTLDLPYAIDDLDQLHALASMRAGDLSFAQWLFLPHNEHILVFVRLLYLLATSLSGLNSLTPHIIIILVILSGALLCAFLAQRVSGSGEIAFLAGTVYACAAGSVSWMLIFVQFSLAAVLLAAGLVPFVSLAPITPRRIILSFLCVIGVASSMPGAVAVTVAIPLFFLLEDTSTAFRRRQLAVIYLVLAVCLIGITRIVLIAQNVTLNPAVNVRAIGLGAWLIFTAPVKLITSFVPFRDPSLTVLAICSVPVWCVSLYTLIRLDRRTRALLTSLWLGASVFAFLIGVGRTDSSLLSLFVTDRYYYFFILPLAIQSAVVASLLFHWIKSLLPQFPSQIAALSLAVLCSMMAHGKLDARIPEPIFSPQQKAFIDAKPLLNLIKSRASSANKPLTLTNGALPFDGVHKQTISLSCLFYSQFPRGLPNVTVTPAAISEDDARVQNELLEGWAHARGVQPPVCVVAGRLQDARQASWIDFRNGSYDYAVRDGFHGWEGTFRWMSRQGTVRILRTGSKLFIRAHAPLPLLRKKWTEARSIVVDVAVDNRSAGAIKITQSGDLGFTLSVPEPDDASRASPTADVTLTSHFVWRAVDLDPTLQDERELSIALTAIGFTPVGEGHTAPYGCSNLTSPGHN